MLTILGVMLTVRLTIGWDFDLDGEKGGGRVEGELCHRKCF